MSWTCGRIPLPLVFQSPFLFLFACIRFTAKLRYAVSGSVLPQTPSRRQGSGGQLWLLPTCVLMLLVLLSSTLDKSVASVALGRYSHNHERISSDNSRLLPTLLQASMMRAARMASVLSPTATTTVPILAGCYLYAELSAMAVLLLPVVRSKTLGKFAMPPTRGCCYCRFFDFFLWQAGCTTPHRGTGSDGRHRSRDGLCMELAVSRACAVCYM